MTATIELSVQKETRIMSLPIVRRTALSGSSESPVWKQLHDNALTKAIRT